MKKALEQAQQALQKNEVPIGAVIVCESQIIAKAHNMTEALNDPTAHAEMQAITAATNTLGGKYLKNCTIYVTVEPCPMCAAALRWAQIQTIVWGAEDKKFGYTQISEKIIHPKTNVIKGILKEQCTLIISSFFKKIRL